jgi:uncharacterized protein (UPF0335 family)
LRTDPTNSDRAQDRIFHAASRLCGYMSGPVQVAGDQLRTIVERIEKVEEELRELSEAKKEIDQEAKSNGFDVKIRREVIRVRKQDQNERDEQESLLATYLQANTESKESRLIAGARRPCACCAPLHARGTGRRSYLADAMQPLAAFVPDSVRRADLTIKRK